MNKIFWIIIIFLVVGGFLAFNRDMQRNAETQNEEIVVAQPGEFAVTPIEHATMVLNWNDKVIYTDPTGGAAAFLGKPEPDLVLITDIHGDHLNVETLQAVVKEKTVVVMPQAVKDQINVDLPGTEVVLANGANTTEAGFLITAVPMYNMPESAESRHVKGRGNGYVVEAAGLPAQSGANETKRIYISGDTGNIPEARAFTNIDHAFVTMNLPYTMSVDDAAAMVLAFKPARVTPYHYRGEGGLSDINRFRDLVNAGDSNIVVDIMDFYPSIP